MAYSWLTSTECSCSSMCTSSGSSSVTNWLEFIFLSPCPQRLLFSSVDVLFLSTCVVLAAINLYSRSFETMFSGSPLLYKPLIQVERPQFKVSLRFKVPCVLTALLALSYAGICILAFSRGVHSPWSFAEAFFRLFQALSHLVILVLVFHENKFGAVYHPMPIRVYWMVSLVLVALFSASGVARMVTFREKIDQDVRIDDFFALASLPVFVFLFVVAFQGKSGISIVGEGKKSVDDNVSLYADASLISKAMWLWMNPLLSKGSKVPLKVDQVPALPPGYLSQRLAQLFETNWLKSENAKSRVLLALLRCFWKDISTTAVLAIVKLCVTYVGPVLIQSFVDYTSGEYKTNPWKGYNLVLILLVAKVVEVLSSHHLNFETTKLGMLVRSTLITALYKKGLSLSFSSRQAHGVGQIVNYMAVDSTQISNMIPQMHALWLMPLQIGISLALLYAYIGIAMLVSVAAVVMVGVLTFFIAKKNNKFQFRLMVSRDSRMKTTNEVLNNMRVIKFQAWEEHLSDKVQRFREEEYGWLRKFMYTIAMNMSVLWSVPVVIAALTFFVAVFMRVPLEAGTVFTITTILKILQDPIRSFPQALMEISQAMISFGRLDAYLTSHELRTETVEIEDQGGLAVEVVEGSFSWEDEGEDNVLENINFRVKKGQLAAIVGTVGSGKSSLLAAVLGELHKSSGQVQGGLAVEVVEGSFSWEDEGEDNVLENINFRVKKGQLAAIVGTVGSGKSSLLAAVLGELHKSSGQALSAHVWRCVTRARNLPPEKETICRMAVNNRVRMNPPISENYIGNCIGTSFATATAGDLSEHGLGWAAWKLHEAVKSYSDEKIREYMDYWMEKRFVNQLSLPGPSGLVMTSSPRFDMYGNEFGLGKAVAICSGAYDYKYDVKITLYPGFEGGGSMDLDTCLPPDSMTRLEEDMEFMETVISSPFTI